VHHAANLRGRIFPDCSYDVFTSDPAYFPTFFMNQHMTIHWKALSQAMTAKV
jgi:hypothetical protein